MGTPRRGMILCALMLQLLMVGATASRLLIQPTRLATGKK